MPVRKQSGPLSESVLLWLVVALLGGVVLAIGDLIATTPASWSLAGLALFLAGIAGLCLVAYRNNRRAGASVLRSLGPVARAAARLVWDLLP